MKDHSFVTAHCVYHLMVWRYPVINRDIPDMGCVISGNVLTYQDTLSHNFNDHNYGS